MPTEATPERGASLGAEASAGEDDVRSIHKRRVIGEAKPKDRDTEQAISKGVDALVALALNQSGATVVDASITRRIERMIAELDERLSRQVNAILHHPEFKKLESAWLGLEYLLRNSATGAGLKVRVLNASKDEVAASLETYRDQKLAQGPLYRKIFSDGLDTLGGEPFGCLVADYQFGPSGPDIEFLTQMSRIASGAHCPFIAGAAPAMLDCETFDELPAKPNIAEIFEQPAYAGWRALRKFEDSRYLGLAMPRFIGRQRWGGPDGRRVAGFDFREDLTAAGHEKFTWINAAYAMAANITRSFNESGWCARIRGVESGGAVPDLPMIQFRGDDGGVEVKPPTEVAITMEREGELSAAGLMPLCHVKGENFAAFIGAQSVNLPAFYGGADPDGTASARMGARLPYLFAVSRFAHYLTKMIYEKLIGGPMEHDEAETMLNEWLNANYVLQNTQGLSDIERAKKPLAYAKVTVTADPENPGYYASVFELRPHFQFEGMSVALKLTTRAGRSEGGGG